MTVKASHQHTSRIFKHTVLLVAVLFLTASCGVFRNRWSPAYYAGKPVSGDYRPKGIVDEVYYPGSVPGPTMRRMIVYLPGDYYQNEKDYPVVYLLHGARGYETSWIRKGDILRLTDSLLTHQLAEPFILVMPNVNQYDNDADFEYSRYKDAFESLFEVDGTVESGFMHDVVQFVDKIFRTRAEKSGRAIAGLSIGGLQCIHLSASHPDAFDYIGVFSPITWTIFKASPYKKFFDGLDGKLEVQFRNPPKGYYIYTGKNDYVHFAARDFHKKLQKRSYPHYYIETNGSHEWYNWKDYYISFMEAIFKQ